jgi:hypothetical protein
MAIDFKDLDLDLDDGTDDADEEASGPPKVTLEELAARPGQAGALARELLEIKREREAKAEAARHAAEAEATLAEGEPDWSDPAFLDGLRQSVLAQRTESQPGTPDGPEEVAGGPAIPPGHGDAADDRRGQGRCGGGRRVRWIRPSVRPSRLPGASSASVRAGAGGHGGSVRLGRVLGRGRRSRSLRRGCKG